MLRFLLAAVMLAFASPALAEPADIAAASRSVVRILIVSTDGDYFYYQGHGSGIAVTPNTVVTNYHVIDSVLADDSLVVAVIPSEGKQAYVATISATSPRNDLALLKLTNKATISPATLFSGAVTDNSAVSALGYPGNVDAAQGLGLDDMVRPTSPVPGDGHVFTGRRDQAYDTLLHTAEIGSGNSGGPLLDPCGRVIGVNAAGTVTDNGTDASFYFAVSMRELLPFLAAQGVKAQVVDTPCRSLAELNQLDAKLSAEELARKDAERQAREKAAADAREKARTEAERQVLEERDNLMALAAVLLLASIAASGAAFVYHQRGNGKAMKIAIGGVAAFVAGAAVAWAFRPPLSTIDDRAFDLMPKESASATAEADNGTGKMICVIDQQRSRITFTKPSDVPLDWSESGCVNGQTQYGLGADGWSRIFVKNGEETVSIGRYDPDTRTYKVERYLLGYDMMQKVREARGKVTPPSCQASESDARAFGESQAAIKALLPAEPNERLVYKCSPAP